MPSPNSTPTILLVDDEPDLREMLGRIIASHGYRVVEAGSVFDAQAALKEQKIDAVLTDLRMPGASGLDLLSQLAKSATPRPLLFLMTGFPDVSVEEARASGAAGLYLKPLEINDLMNDLRDALSKRPSL